MEYEAKTIIDCLRRVLDKEVDKPILCESEKEDKVLDHDFLWTSDISALYKNCRLKATGDTHDLNSKLTSLKINCSDPLGTWILAKKPDNTTRAYCTSDFSYFYIPVTLTFPAKRNKGDLLTIFAKIAKEIDDHYKASIETCRNDLINQISANNPPSFNADDIVHIPFYGLVGLNGSGFKVFDIFNRENIRGIQKNDVLKLNIGNCPILFAVKDNKIQLKSDYSVNNISDNEEQDARPFRLFLNNFLTYEPRFRQNHDPIKHASRPSIISSDNGPTFLEVLRLKNNSVEHFLMPAAVMNKGGGFNLIGRADPLEDVDYRFFSRNFDDLPKDLKISRENFCLLDDETIRDLDTYIGHTTFPNRAANDRADILTRLKTKLNLTYFLTDSTRIKRYKTGKQNDELYTLIYYAKNAVSADRRNKPKQNPLPSFPSHNYKDDAIGVRAFLNKAHAHIARQKPIDRHTQKREVALEYLDRARESVNLSKIIRESLFELGDHLKEQRGHLKELSATDMIRHAYSIPEAKHFYKAYKTECLRTVPKDLPEWPRADQEWCHLIAHKDSLGNNSAKNLVAGSYHANTEQCAIESAIRASKYYNSIGLKITAYLVPNELWVRSFPAGELYNYLQEHPLLNTGAPPSPAVEIENAENGPMEEEKDDGTTTQGDSISPENLYKLIMYGEPLPNTNNDREKFIYAIWRELQSRGKTDFTAKNLVGYYSHQQEDNNVKLKNALRSVFDDISSKYYLHPPAAAFIRYRIFVNGVRKIDYVVDAMRDEFDVNEYRLTRWLISTALKEDLNELNEYEDIEESDFVPEETDMDAGGNRPPKTDGTENQKIGKKTIAKIKKTTHTKYSTKISTAKKRSTQKTLNLANV
ncbi:hypothetical protein [Pseudomonas caspiana]|uniref:Uncharacterized protein n=1 Tax=Pseudomonas caspiana TaxID=1451454 RepID=A0A1Y3NYI5_9PSED|nr:hypothetical protein [Pseudomonas caspiana]OUM71562.1 hypothetical protein AUC60_22480 [Pseudomonas caspiana]